MIDEMDYAILVATPDDVLTKRDVQSFSMRDNVLLELGLFMAKLGRGRTYLVTPPDQIHIPSDLLGVPTAYYQVSAEAGDWSAALEEPCETIRAAMREADRELTDATRRFLVKRLFEWTTKLQGLLVALQAQSAQCLTDRDKFENLQSEISKEISEAVMEYQGDADRLNVGPEYQNLANSALEAAATLPFPEEAVVSSKDVVRSGLDMFFGKKSIESQIDNRMDALVSRYDTWWNDVHSAIAQTLHKLQVALVATI